MFGWAISRISCEVSLKIFLKVKFRKHFSQIFNRSFHQSLPHDFLVVPMIFQIVSHGISPEDPREISRVSTRSFQIFLPQTFWKFLQGVSVISCYEVFRGSPKISFRVPSENCSFVAPNMEFFSEFQIFGLDLFHSSFCNLLRGSFWDFYYKFYPDYPQISSSLQISPGVFPVIP